MPRCRLPSAQPTVVQIERNGKNAANFCCSRRHELMVGFYRWGQKEGVLNFHKHAAHQNFYCNKEKYSFAMSLKPHRFIPQPMAARPLCCQTSKETKHSSLLSLGLWVGMVFVSLLKRFCVNRTEICVGCRIPRHGDLRNLCREKPTVFLHGCLQLDQDIATAVLL